MTNNTNEDEQFEKHYIDVTDIYEDGVMEAEIMADDFDDVLDLTSIKMDEDSSTIMNFSGSMNDSVLAEYNNIDTVSISKNQTQIADKFIKDVSKFIKRFDDVQLTAEHRKYIDTVANLKLQNLAEYLIMREMNKDLLFNIMNQINMAGGEDFVLIQNYNILVNTQMKLIKECNSLINALPTEMRNLRNDVLSDKELIGADTTDISDAVISSNNTYNSGRSLLSHIEEEERLMEERRQNQNK